LPELAGYRPLRRISFPKISSLPLPPSVALVELRGFGLRCLLAHIQRLPFSISFSFSIFVQANLLILLAQPESTEVVTFVQRQQMKGPPFATAPPPNLRRCRR
jgi:hypothetical protein